MSNRRFPFSGSGSGERLKFYPNMKAIIAEKPSVGMDIARVVGATDKKDGYCTGNGYMVTWALGHLVSLAMPGAYGYTKTSAENLPMLPDPFRLVSRQVRTDKGMVTDIAAANGMVTVTLSRANGALPALLDIPIVKETGGVPLGTGPYVLAGTGENLALEARSDWWQGNALPRDTIPLRAIQEADDLIHAFDTRDIALVSTDLTGTNALGFSGSFAAVDYPTSTMLYVGFNTADGPCRSAQVRQALLRGFDRAAVSTAQFSRHAQPAALPVSPASPLYDEALAQTLDYAPQAMEPLLTAAGYTRADGVWQKEGRPLALTFVAPNNNADRLAAAETLAANLTDAGLDWDQYLQALTAGEFDLYLGEGRLTADFDLTAFLTPGGALNYGKYSDAEALNRLSAFRAAVGQWRTEPARQLYEYLAGQPPFAVICFKNWSVLTQWSRIDGLTPAQQNIFHQFSDWKIT